MKLDNVALLKLWNSTTNSKDRDPIVKALQAKGLFPDEYMKQWDKSVGAYPDYSDPEFLQRLLAKKEFAENEAQLKLHETAYNNNVTKVKHATKKLADLKNRIKKYDAELKLSRAEAELAKLAQSFNFDVTTDFGQIEDVIQDKIGLNRAKVRVAADLSGEGLEDIKREAAVEEAMASDALREFEIEMGMVTPETAGVKADDKELGTQRLEQTAG